VYTSELARILRAPLRAFPARLRRALRGPGWAASCRRSQSKPSLRKHVKANDHGDAVQGWTGSWIPAPFAVPSIAARAG